MDLFCTNCGNQLREGAKFCGKCGNKINDEESVQNTQPPQPTSNPFSKAQMPVFNPFKNYSANNQTSMFNNCSNYYALKENEINNNVYNNYFNDLKIILASKLQININLIALESSPNDIGADSLDLVEIVMDIEELFYINIPDEDAGKLFTVKDCVDYIYRKNNGNYECNKKMLQQMQQSLSSSINNNSYSSNKDNSQSFIGSFCEGFKDGFKKGYKNNSGCFITTAVCDSFNKPDDCYELTQFRLFRDNWLKQEDDGETLIKEYYKNAPKIVETINSYSNKADIYLSIWNTYLKKCLHFIEDKKYKECKTLYIKMVQDLEKKYLL